MSGEVVAAASVQRGDRWPGKTLPDGSSHRGSDRAARFRVSGQL